MGAWKSLGPGGFPARFFQTSWDIVAINICDFARYVWNHPENVAKVNLTDICLIPKFQKPEFINQSRLISLCNVIYKVLTKIVVNRLKDLMPNIMYPFQNGFVPTRSIHENNVVDQEMIHNMNKMKGKTDFFSL